MIPAVAASGSMSVREDLGFTVPDRPAQKRATSHHRWKLIAKTFGVSRHRCERCGVVKTTNHADRVTKYTRGHSISTTCPPCIGAQE